MSYHAWVPRAAVPGPSGACSSRALRVARPIRRAARRVDGHLRRAVCGVDSPIGRAARREVNYFRWVACRGGDTIEVEGAQRATMAERRGARKAHAVPFDVDGVDPVGIEGYG